MYVLIVEDLEQKILMILKNAINVEEEGSILKHNRLLLDLSNKSKLLVQNVEVKEQSLKINAMFVMVINYLMIWRHIKFK